MKKARGYTRGWRAKSVLPYPYPAQPNQVEYYKAHGPTTLYYSTTITTS